jgi:hypothetical protein
MHQNLEQFIGQVVAATKLRGKIRDQVFKELSSHILEEERELQLQGYSEEKIYSIIKERFGDPEKIAQELYMTNKNLTKAQMIGYGMLLWFVLSLSFNFIELFPRFYSSSLLDSIFLVVGLPFISFTTIFLGIGSLLVPFSWLFIGVTVSVFLVVRLILHRSIMEKFREGLTSWSATLWIMAQAMILQWSSILFSIHNLPDTNNINTPIATVGFPFKIFDLPHPPLGGDQPPFETWGKFYLSYGIWFAMSVLLFAALPARLKCRPHIRLFVTTLGCMMSLYGLGWILIKFD